jgi:dienelactone hydrolase
VAYLPSAQVNPSFPDGTSNAWSLAGKPVPPGAIPLQRVSGPVLAVAGADDGIWQSATWARQIVTELDADHAPYPHQALVYPGAGHEVGTVPYLAEQTTVMNPTSFVEENLGGSRAGDAAAQAEGWPQVLALLAGLGTGQR